MLGPWKRVLTGSTKHFVSASRRGVEHARLGRKANDRAYSSGRGLLIDNSLSVQQFLVYGAIGVGISGALYLWKQSQEEPKSDLVTPVLVAKDVPVLGGLSKNSTYIVGDCVMTGKMDEDPMVVPHQLLSKTKLKNVSLGDGEGWALDDKGKLHSWTQSDAIAPFVKLNGYSFKQVSCGSNGFVALLQTNGSVWIRFSKDEPFTLINKGDLKRKSVARLAVGSNHVAALTTDGYLYTLGSNERGQCGIVELKESPRDVPHLVDWKSKFTDVATGLHHTVAITEDGNVVGFGYNKNLQLGKAQEWVQYQPPSIPIVPFGAYNEVRQSEHARFNSKNWNDTTEYVTQYAHSLPAAIEYFSKSTIKASRVVCGDEFTFVIDQEGKMYGFGDGSKGQLARKPARAYTPPTLVHREPFDADGARNVATLSCGSAHCMAMMKNGDLWTWGWNTNGECARQSKVFTPTPTRIPIDPNTVIQSISCSKSATIITL